MSKIFYLPTRKAYDVFAFKAAEVAKSITVATYTILDASILEILNKKKARLVVSVPFYWPCKEDCKDCKKKYNDQIKSYKALRKKYSNINWCFVSGSHMKAMIFDDYKVFVGGRNISNSKTNDAMVMFEDQDIAKSMLKSIDWVIDNNPVEL